MYLYRSYHSDIAGELTKGQKIILIYGPRQVGKTTLAKKILEKLPGRFLEVNADIDRIANILSSRDLVKLKGLVAGYDLLFIDEAQRISDIGINLKILHDELPELRLLVTGSSTLELANLTREPLTGRTLTYYLYPISIFELQNSHTSYEIGEQLENHLLYGMYPEIIFEPNITKKTRYLRELVSSYLYKDVLELSHIRHSDKLTDLLTLLALQVGAQVSLTELGSKLGMSKETVESYLDLLEKSFVIFRLRGFSRNLRKEVTRMSKYYFVDLGVRNMLLENFNPLALRNDVGAIWENFLISERRKTLAHEFAYGRSFFWRTYDQQEIDYLEEVDGKLHAFELKFKKGRKKAPVGWTRAYPDSTFKTINKDNYLEFLSKSRS